MGGGVTKETAFIIMWLNVLDFNCHSCFCNQDDTTVIVSVVLVVDSFLFSCQEGGCVF